MNQSSTKLIQKTINKTYKTLFIKNKVINEKLKAALLNKFSKINFQIHLKINKIFLSEIMILMKENKNFKKI